MRLHFHLFFSYFRSRYVRMRVCVSAQLNGYYRQQQKEMERLHRTCACASLVSTRNVGSYNLCMYLKCMKKKQTLQIAIVLCECVDV